MTVQVLCPKGHVIDRAGIALQVAARQELEVSLACEECERWYRFRVKIGGFGSGTLKEKVDPATFRCADCGKDIGQWDGWTTRRRTDGDGMEVVCWGCWDKAKREGQG